MLIYSGGILIAQFDKHIRGDRWRPLVRRGYQVIALFYDQAARLLLPDYQLAAVDLEGVWRSSQVGLSKRERRTDDPKTQIGNPFAPA